MAFVDSYWISGGDVGSNLGGLLGSLLGQAAGAALGDQFYQTNREMTDFVQQNFLSQSKSDL